jgi:hypothetical protein
MTSLREDTVSASAAYDRDLERADAGIAMALAALQEGDAQRARAVGAHLRGLDAAVAAHEGRLADLDGEFAREARALEHEFACERGSLVARHAAFRTAQLHTLEAVRSAEEARAGEEAADFEQAREALRRRALERLNALQADMDSRVERAEGAFEEAHAAYIAATARRTGEFKALMERTEADALLAERQARAGARMARLLQVWRSRLLNAKRDAKERNEGLHGESSAMAAQVERLKGDIGRNRAAHAARLRTLSGAAAVVKGRLAGALAVGERLCAAQEAARVHESLGEKLDPFALSRGGGGGGGAAAGLLAPPGTLGASLLAECKEAGGSGGGVGGGGEAASEAALAASLGLPVELLAPGAQGAVGESARLAPFYARLNKALLESLALARRRERLRAEAAELAGALAQVQDGMALAPGALDGVNSLLVLNGRAAVDAGAGTALAPCRAAVTESFLASGAPLQGSLPVRLAGPAIVPVRPGAPGVASVVVEGNTVYAQSRMMGGGRR